MKPRNFPGSNMTYRGGKQPRNQLGDHEMEPVGDLPCRRIQPGLIQSVWELTPEERIAIAEGADIELLIMTEPIPPVSIAIHLGQKEIDGVPHGKL